MLAWSDSGRPHHLLLLDEPVLAVRLARDRLPCPKTRHCSLPHCVAKDVPASVERADRAARPHRSGWVWMAMDVHQIADGVAAR